LIGFLSRDCGINKIQKEGNSFASVSDANGNIPENNFFKLSERLVSESSHPDKSR
jgi:hypothetical protein